MDRGEARGLIDSTSNFGEEKYAFAHDLLQEALMRAPARATTPIPPRTAAAHRKAHASRLGDWYEALAYHFREGNDLEKAVVYSLVEPLSKRSA